MHNDEALPCFQRQVLHAFVDANCFPLDGGELQQPSRLFQEGSISGLLLSGSHLCIEAAGCRVHRVTLERLQRMLQLVLGGLEPNFMQAGCHTWCHRQGRIVETARACCLLGNSWSFFKQSCCCCRRTQHLDGIVPLSARKISRLLDW